MPLFIRVDETRYTGNSGHYGRIYSAYSFTNTIKLLVGLKV